MTFNFSLLKKDAQDSFWLIFWEIGANVKKPAPIYGNILAVKWEYFGSSFIIEMTLFRILC